MTLALATPTSTLITGVIGESDAYAQVELTCGTRILMIIPEILRNAYADMLPSLDSTKPILTLIESADGYILYSAETADIIIRDGYSSYEPVHANIITMPKAQPKLLRRAA